MKGAVFARSVLGVAMILGGTPAWGSPSEWSHLDIPGQAPPSGGAECVRVQWETTRDRRGRPVLDGYIYNFSGAPVSKVRLRVVGVDASGLVVSSQMAVVDQVVPEDGRARFEMPLGGPPATYDVAVESFETVDGTGI